MIKYSERFSTVLSRISYNTIARQLLNIAKFSNHDYLHNYIDIGESNNLVTYTPNDRVEKIIESLPKVFKVNGVRNLTHSNANNHIFELLGYDKEKNQYWYPEPEYTQGNILNECVSPTTGKEYVLFQCIETQRLSVVNKVALVQNDSNLDMIFTKNRNTIKVGRLVTSLLSITELDFTQKDVEDFVNLYKSSYDFMDNKGIQFDIVSGDDIAKWYKKKNYQEGGGILNNSCMCEKESYYFDIYTKNSQCSMVILFSDEGQLIDGKYKSDKIKGRALLWDVKYKGQMVKFMDRVYTANDSDTKLFEEWAKENGWWYKSSQSMYPDTNLTNGIETIKDKFEVKLDNPEAKCYPYMDTMCYWIDGVITNDAEREHTREFRTTHGGYVIINDEGYREEIYTMDEQEEMDAEMELEEDF